tara:strand:- start:1324 stop:1674 length:351 start_codon:yes stop_codon:yes gene_type:complete
MRHISKNLFLVIVAVCFSVSAWAIEPDELQGTVIDINEGDMSITVRVSEVGSQLDTPVNSVQTYMISENTNIVDDREFEILADDLGDIQRDEEVTLDFDIEDPTYARTIIFFRTDS